MALVLTRNVGEEFVIGDELITVKLLKTFGSQASFAITAPDHMSIHRREIFERIKTPKIYEEREDSKKRVISE